MNLKCNNLINKKEIKKLINWFVNNHGPIRSTKLLENIKNLGLKIATESGISIGIEDLKIPNAKKDLFKNSLQKLKRIELKKHKGEFNNFEYWEKNNEIWNQTNEILKEEIIKDYKENEPLNPVYIMVTSGARGNLTQIRQLIGMRGLMSDNEGRIINTVIKNNLKEGLNIPEYFTSCYGARKGLIDTALKTANSGYLTRKLIYAVQNQIIKKPDCKTKRNLLLLNSRNSKHYYKLNTEKLIGRILGKEVILKAKKIENGQDICKYIAKKIIGVKKIFIRTPLLCKLNIGICQMCYGWNLGNGRLVELGESIGVLAAQSVSEPGTQLTMRTFHTGGAFADTIAETIISNLNGKVIYNSKKAGIEVNTSNNEKAFFTTKNKKILIFENNIKKNIINLPKYSILFTKNRQKVFKKQIIAEKSELKIFKKRQSKSSEKKYVKTKISGKIEIHLSKNIKRTKSKSLKILNGNIVNYKNLKEAIYKNGKKETKTNKGLKENTYTQIIKPNKNASGKNYSTIRNYAKGKISSMHKAKILKNEYLIKSKNTKQILLKKTHSNSNIKTDTNICTYKGGKFLENGEILESRLQNTWANSIEEIRKKKIKVEKNNSYVIPENCITTVKDDQIVKKGTTIIVYKFKNRKTKDITQGLTKIEEILENKKIIKNKINNKLHKEYKKYKDLLTNKNTFEKSINKIQIYIIKRLQQIYSSQNVIISDKHFEIIIIRQMTSKVIITKTGDSKLICGELIDRKKVEKINRQINRQINYRPIIIGIKKLPQYSTSFIAACSFEETTKILAQAAIEGKIDWLYGLKENIIFGNLVPVGTGYQSL